MLSKIVSSLRGRKGEKDKPLLKAHGRKPGRCDGEKRTLTMREKCELGDSKHGWACNNNRWEARQEKGGSQPVGGIYPMHPSGTRLRVGGQMTRAEEKNQMNNGGKETSSRNAKVGRSTSATFSISWGSTQEKRHVRRDLDAGSNSTLGTPGAEIL